LIYFSLRDDTFTADRARTIEFCRLLIESRAYLVWNCQSRVNALDEELLVWMKRAGCECIQLGVESGSPRILSQLGKTITPEQVKHTSSMIRNVGINLSIYLITDVPGETEDDLRQTIELIKSIRPEDGHVSPLAYFPGTRMFEEAVSSGRIGRDIFEGSKQAAVYAVDKPGRTSRRILQCLERSAPKDAIRFNRHKSLLGFCYITNVLAGEFYRLNGEYGAAEREFSEITEREPGNPWGWYLLGDLFSEMRKAPTAFECYKKVCKSVNPVGRRIKTYVKSGITRTPLKTKPNESLFHDPDTRDERNLFKSLVKCFALEVGKRRSLGVFNVVSYRNLDLGQCQPYFDTLVVGCFNISVAA